MTTTIYRVQDKHGNGPFSSHIRWEKLEQKAHRDMLEPWSVQFPDLELSDDIYTGCSSADDLRLWFSEREMKLLSLEDYSAVQMTVDEILAKSDVQLVFRRKKPLNRDVKRFDLYAPRMQRT